MYQVFPVLWFNKIMNDRPFINILIAEDNDVSRELMAGILKTQGYRILGAVDGDSAIDVVRKNDVDVALVDINMAPKGGFEFVKYLVVKGLDIPVVIITSDSSSDILMQANDLGVTRVLQKPVDPVKLQELVYRILKRKGLNPQPLAVDEHQIAHPPEEIMKMVIDLADGNAKSARGGPFGAIVTDAKGAVLGRGVNGVSSRIDPTAHAEVMAIRQAAEKIGKADLSECVLYCSSEPTMMGKSLVLSVGIQKVYYGLSHGDVGEIRTRAKTADPQYIQLGRDEALEMFRSWEAQDKKVSD